MLSCLSYDFDLLEAFPTCFQGHGVISLRIYTSTLWSTSEPRLPK